MLYLLHAGHLNMQVLLTVWFCHRNYKKSTKNLKCVRTSSLKIPFFWTCAEFSSLTTISLSGVDPIHWISIIVLLVLVPSMQLLQLSWNRCLFWCMYIGCIDLRCCFVFPFTLLNILLYSYHLVQDQSEIEKQLNDMDALFAAFDAEVYFSLHLLQDACCVKGEWACTAGCLF